MFDPYQESAINLHSAVIANGVPTYNYLTIILPLITALLISMTIIPVMARLAPRLGMVDLPDSRKVHVKPIPRVGGVGIVIGSLIPITLVLPLDQTLQAFIFGALVLFAFGAMDDCKELGHYVKFVGQFIAVITLVYFGDVYVTQMPFMGGEQIASSVGKLFTVIAMVGMINAINHSDGLDGLAGGESLLSLVCIAWLAWLAGGETIMIIVMATIGGVFGFMRFNTYPAQIFMGDGGSQFLGYTLGFLAIVLTQDANPVLSPALVVLILGLPIADIIAVFAQRIYKKMNWFRASRNHIHHRLLDLGFHHYESVVLVYSVQTLLVLCAVTMPYESDVLIMGVYLAVISTIFVLLTVAERAGWKMRTTDRGPLPDAVITSKKKVQWVVDSAYCVVLSGIALFLVSGALITTDVPADFATISIILFVLLLVRLLTGYRLLFLPLRLLVYVTITFIVYLLNTYQPDYLSGADPVTYGLFGVIVIGVSVVIRFSDRSKFDATPMDYLIVMAVLALALLAHKGVVDSRVTAIALKSIIMFYGSELIFERMRRRWSLFNLAVLTSLLIVGVRGLLLHIV